jgi:hypothetical protein
MLRRVALVRTDVSQELSTSFIRVTRIGEQETTLAVTNHRLTLRRNTSYWYLVFLRSMRRLFVTASVVPSSPILVTLMKEALSSCETSLLTRATRRNSPEDAILLSQTLLTSTSRSKFSNAANLFEMVHDTSLYPLLHLTSWDGTSVYDICAILVYSLLFSP